MLVTLKEICKIADERGIGVGHLMCRILRL